MNSMNSTITLSWFSVYAFSFAVWAAAVWTMM